MDLRELLFQLKQFPGLDVEVTVDIDGDSWDITEVDLDDRGGVVLKTEHP